MAQQTVDYLKDKFMAGDQPTQQDFHDWLDSFLHVEDYAPGGAEINVKASGYNAVGNGTADDFEAFKTANDDLAALGGGTIYVPAGANRVYRIADNIAFDNTVQLRIEKGARIDPAVGVTLSNISLFEPPDRQIFGGSGAVTLTKYQTHKTVWWGDTGDGATNDYAAINKANTALNALAGHARLVIARGTHILGTSLAFSSYAWLDLEPGAVLSPSAGVTLSNIQLFNTLPILKFSGDGDIRFARSVRTAYPEWWGAEEGGIVDCEDARYRALVAVGESGGGGIEWGAGQYLVTMRHDIEYANIEEYGLGKGITEILFDPADNSQDRFCAVHAGDASGLGASTLTTDTIAIGDTSFVASGGSGDVDDLAPDDWVLVFGYHPEPALGPYPGEIVEFDWVQVASVVGDTVTVRNPFRANFGEFGDVRFQKVINVVENVKIRDMTIKTLTRPDGSTTLGVTLSVCKDCTIEHVNFDVESGASFSTYRAMGPRILHCDIARVQTAVNEISVAVDVVVDDNTFNSEGVAANRSVVFFSFGTGFFRFTGNRLTNLGNIGVQLSFGVHDGFVMHNHFGYIDNVSSSGIPVLGRGIRNIIVKDNDFVGGEQLATSQAVNFGHYFPPAAGSAIYNRGNILGPNCMGKFFTNQYTVSNTPDGERIVDEQTHGNYTGSAVNLVTAAVTTTDNTITDLFTRVMSTNTAYQFDIKIQARRTDTGTQIGYYWRRVCVYRGASGGAAIQATQTPAADTEAGFTGTITIDISTDTLRVRVTGESGKTMAWTAKIEWQAATAVDA